MAQFETRSLFSFAKEVIVVLIGVLIALLINEWRETSNNQRFVASVMTAIERDIQTSKKELEEVTQRHLATIDTVLKYGDDDSSSLFQIIQNSGGVQYATIKNISLNYMIANRAELLDYEIISLLADIESTADIMDTKFEKFLDFAYTSVEATDAQSKRLFVIHLSNVIDSEQTLLELYDQFLKDTDPIATTEKEN